MISIDEALRLILQTAQSLSAVRVALLDAVGGVLAEPVAADLDSPPHDKAMVDGYAVQAADLAAGKATLTVLEEVVAGDVPHCEVVSQCATRIMTGAPVPRGADAVVMIERSELLPLGESLSPLTSHLPQVKIVCPPPANGANILYAGTVFRAGDVLMPAGARIRAAAIGLLAEIGAVQVAVHRAPRVAIVSTGNELVDAAARPAAGQIRNSNSPLLAALVACAGGVPDVLPIARDDRASLQRAISQGLAADVLLLSGGVSAGVLDLVPQMLREAGVCEIFHKVHIKPGKPLWFGMRDATQSVAQRTLVVGLPGNPVSSLICHEVFVRPMLDRLRGGAGNGLSQEQLPLAEPFVHKGDRPTYWPARFSDVNGRRCVQPLAWRGSADLRSYAEAEALIFFPGDKSSYAAGDEITALRLEK